MIFQLSPPLPLYIINKGTGLAHFLIDYGPESHLYWVVFLDENGECWTVDNTQIRAQNNYTLNRKVDYQG